MQRRDTEATHEERKKNEYTRQTHKPQAHTREAQKHTRTLAQHTAAQVTNTTITWDRHTDFQAHEIDTRAR